MYKICTPEIAKVTKLKLVHFQHLAYCRDPCLYPLYCTVLLFHTLMLTHDQHHSRSSSPQTQIYQLNSKLDLLVITACITIGVIRIRMKFNHTKVTKDSKCPLLKIHGSIFSSQHFRTFSPECFLDCL